MTPLILLWRPSENLTSERDSGQIPGKDKGAHYATANIWDGGCMTALLQGPTGWGRGNVCLRCVRQCRRVHGKFALSKQRPCSVPSQPGLAKPIQCLLLCSDICNGWRGFVFAKSLHSPLCLCLFSFRRHDFAEIVIETDQVHCTGFMSHFLWKKSV